MKKNTEIWCMWHLKGKDYENSVPVLCNSEESLLDFMLLVSLDENLSRNDVVETYICESHNEYMNLAGPEGATYFKYHGGEGVFEEMEYKEGA